MKKITTSRTQAGENKTMLTPFLLSLIDPKNPKDPIGLQHLTNPAELKKDEFNYETVWERDEDFIDRENRLLQRKYPDIVVLRIANTCHSFCRFCFEKERTLQNKIKTKVGIKEFKNALNFIKKDKKIRQVLLSGGDPTILPDKILKNYLEKLIKIPHLKTIRINTRALLHNPFRITDDFAKMLGFLQKKSWNLCKKGKEIKIGVHFNHPKEITREAITAIRKLQKEGIGIYNQTVLLKNINDNLTTLKTLFGILRQEGVALHYLSQAMAVPGTSHFRTKVRKGQKLMEALRKTKEFRGQLPVFELSHYTGKQIIPAEMNDNFFETTIKKNNRTIKVIKFLSDITGKWEIFPDGHS